MGRTIGKTIGDVESLRNKILEQARKQAAETLDRARRVSERDMVYAKAEADEVISQQRAAIQPMIEAEKKKTMVTAQIKAKRKLLEKKEELVSQAFDEAEKELEKLKGSDAYMDIILKLIEEGAASINSDIIIEYSEKDKDIFTPEAISSIKSRMAKSLTVGTDIQMQFRCVGNIISAGVLIRSADGRVIIDNSFSGRLNRLKEELRGKVSEMLLEE